VNLAVVVLADITMLRLLQFSRGGLLLDLLRLEACRGKHIRRGEHRLLAQLPNAGLGQHGLVAFLPVGFALAFLILDESSPDAHIRAIDLPSGLQQPGPLLDRDAR
jgi:hypothetical protein